MFDATLHLHPDLYPLAGRLVYDHLYAWSVRNATLVITGTATARDDIVRCYDVPHERIRVVPLAPAEIFVPLSSDDRVMQAVVRHLGGSAPYFLFVGKLTARRNVPKLMEAFAEVKRRTTTPHKLLIVGLNTTNLDLAELAAQLEITADFCHVEYVSDDDLTMLYNGADAFVMPYTYEAVSLTALEAQATGTPVLTVDVPGLHETTGGAALLIPRVDVAELADAMARLATDAVLRRELSERGLAHARRFSWERCSAETLAVMEEAGRLVAPGARAIVS
jgi:glycosyltransferase involved in cell wall biosynthesis